MGVITVSRTLGSEGAAIARLVAERLKYRCFDREELERVARRHQYFRADLDVLDERSSPVFDQLFRDSPKEYLSFLHDVVCDAAEQDELVVVGRGGQAILRDLATAFHVRVDAPLDVRIHRVMERMRVSEAQASKMIKEVDRERAQFVRQAFGVNPEDPLNYHLVLNTGKMDVATAARMVVESFRQMPTESTEGEDKVAFHRYRVVKAIRSQIIRNPLITCPSTLDVRCDDRGVVTLSGRLDRPGEKSVIESEALKVKGVTRVIDQLG